MAIKISKIDNQNVQDILPLTSMQEGMLFHYLKNQDSNLYFEQLVLEFSGNSDLNIMKEASKHVV